MTPPRTSRHLPQNPLVLLRRGEPVVAVRWGLRPHPLNARLHQELQTLLAATRSVGVEGPESIGDALRESDKSCLELLGTIDLLAWFSKKGKSEPTTRSGCGGHD